MNNTRCGCTLPIFSPGVFLGAPLDTLRNWTAVVYILQKLNVFPHGNRNRPIHVMLLAPAVYRYPQDVCISPWVTIFRAERCDLLPVGWGFKAVDWAPFSARHPLGNPNFVWDSFIASTPSGLRTNACCFPKHSRTCYLLWYPLCNRKMNWSRAGSLDRPYPCPLYLQYQLTPPVQMASTGSWSFDVNAMSIVCREGVCPLLIVSACLYRVHPVSTEYSVPYRRAHSGLTRAISHAFAYFEIGNLPV